MLRTQISLTEAERRTLDDVAARTGRSISSLIRDAIEQTYGPGGSLEDDLAALRAGFGAWSDRREDGAAYVERLRSGERLSALVDQGAERS